MSRIAYVNGAYVPHSQAAVHVEDRGYQFADAVYEVCEVRNGKLVDERRHLKRLGRSLSELQISSPMNDASLGLVLREVVQRNRVRDGLVYVQVSRGVAPRNHLFPAQNVAPSLVITARSASIEKAQLLAERGVGIVTVPDNRWDRVDIKSVSLLPNILAKQFAHESGAYEAWFVDKEGLVTEGSSTNAWIVTKDGGLVTRSADADILRGITREVVLELAQKLGLTVEERAFSVEEAETAREAFITAATNLVMPVVKINDRAIGNGAPGHIATQLRSLFHTVAEISD